MVPGEVGTEYQANAGYDLTTGLGSVNVTNLVSQWSTVTFNPTTTILSLGASSINHGTPMPFSISVTPNNGTGVPTGDAFVLAYTGPLGEAPTSIGFWTLSGGSVSANTRLALFRAGITFSLPDTPGTRLMRRVHPSGLPI